MKINVKLLLIISCFLLSFHEKYWRYHEALKMNLQSIIEKKITDSVAPNFLNVENETQRFQR